MLEQAIMWLNIVSFAQSEWEHYVTLNAYGNDHPKWLTFPDRRYPEHYITCNMQLLIGAETSHWAWNSYKPSSTYKTSSFPQTRNGGLTDWRYEGTGHTVPEVEVGLILVSLDHLLFESFVVWIICGLDHLWFG